MGKNKRCIKSPTEKQIRLADAIADALGIDFPQSSRDFTRHVYWQFINDHIEDAKMHWRDDGEYIDMWDEEMAWFNPLNE